LARIEELVNQYGVEKIVLGFPKNMNDTEGERCEKTKEFKELLEKRTGLEVILWDERLTTIAANEAMIEMGIRRENRKEYIDQIAAIFILQEYLDYVANRKEE
jgi:putative Holliday junction resolvase